MARCLTEAELWTCGVAVDHLGALFGSFPNDPYAVSLDPRVLRV